MTYQETLDHLYTKLPNFTREGAAALKPDLTNTIAICDILGKPQNTFKSIHVAGTNGKGSTSNMLSAIFQKHGFKTGLYTSPHLIDFRERIRINGEMVSRDFVINFVEKISPHIDRIKPSFFEITVAMCFQYFAEHKVDYAIIETGLGGRLDSTNIISPILSIITNIGYDHADLLGNTLPLIAREKAGITKYKIPVIIGESNSETDPVFIEKSKQEEAIIYFADTNPNYYNTEIESDLKGSYQQKNLVTVMQAVEVLKTLGIPLDLFKVASALQNVKQLTGFSGRWEILSTKPLIIADTGHNEHGLKLVIEQVLKQKYENLHIVFGMLKDKDRTKILKLLPQNATYYFCSPNLPRGLNPDDLLLECLELGLKGNVFTTVKNALQAAKNNAKKDDLIFIGGSTFVVAEII